MRTGARAVDALCLIGIAVGARNISPKPLIVSMSPGHGQGEREWQSRARTSTVRSSILLGLWLWLWSSLWARRVDLVRLLLLSCCCWLLAGFTWVRASISTSAHPPRPFRPTPLPSLSTPYCPVSPSPLQYLGLGMPAWIVLRAKLDFDPKYCFSHFPFGLLQTL
jgi:hypothetical protein